MCVSRGQPIYSGAHMRATDHTGCCCAQIADHRAHNTPFSTYVTEVVCDFGAAPPQAATSSPAIGGMTPSKPPIRRRHAAKELRMAQNPHRHRSGGCRIAYKNGTVSVGATKLAQQQPRRAASVQNSPCSPPHRMSGTKLSLLTRNGPIWRNLRMQGEFCTAFTTKNPSRENFVPNTRQS